MPNTITTYNTFTGGTKARATQVNQNFSNYRGTLLPINEDSASASTNTHDLGSSDHRWNDFYANTINLRGATSTSAFKVVPSTSSTAGSVAFMFGATTACSFDPNGLVASGMTSATFSFSGSTATATTIAASSLTITTRGRPVLIGLQNDTGSAAFYIQRTATGTVIYMDLKLFRDGVMISYARIMTSGLSDTNSSYVLYGGPFTFLDSPSAGSHTYYLTYQTTSINLGGAATGVKIAIAEF